VIDIPREVSERLARASSLCVLTGSGISSESGLPTFRGANGLWRTHRVEEREFLDSVRAPQAVRAAHLRARPNAAHVALAELEGRFDDFTLATQNVDSLHVRAGSKNVLELHGSLREARCDRCDARRSLDRELAPDVIDHACGGRFRPDIVWFGESLPAGVFERAAAAARRADVVIVVGTSGMVEPAASLATRAPRRDAYVVEINPEETAISPRANVVLRGPASAYVPALLRALGAETGTGSRT
jgi:NAD-dependent deacetylase